LVIWIVNGISVATSFDTMAGICSAGMDMWPFPESAIFVR
jgi:uncharacterized protein (UPF0210 family)